MALAGAFCYGELAWRRPRAGGGYVYLREAWGPLPAFLYGWALLLVIATGAIAAVAVTFADYTVALTGLAGAAHRADRRGRHRAAGRGQLRRRAARRDHRQRPHRAQARGARRADRRRPRAGPARCGGRSRRRPPRGAAALAPSARRWCRCSSPTAGGSRPTSSPRRSSPPSARCRGRSCSASRSSRRCTCSPTSRTCGCWARRARGQQRPGGGHHAALLGPAGRDLHRGRHRRLHLRLPRPRHPGDAARAARRWPPTACSSRVWPRCTRATARRRAAIVRGVGLGDRAHAHRDASRQLVDYVSFGDWIFFGLTVAGLSRLRAADAASGAPARRGGLLRAGVPVDAGVLRRAPRCWSWSARCSETRATRRSAPGCCCSACRCISGGPRSTAGSGARRARGESAVNCSGHAVGACSSRRAADPP